MPRSILWPLRILGALLVLAVGSLTLGLLGAYQYLHTDVPDVATLRDVRLQVPLRVYSRDNKLIAQVGEQRRIPLAFDAYPKQVVNAILAAEDTRFFEHSGIDYRGLVRAMLKNLASGSRREGGGTITMQLARNIFLTPERSYRRKLIEIFSAWRIEQEFSKQEILELYLNKIFLGQRAYGIGAAAEVYFGKTVEELSVAEIAMLAGLPRAPSRDNPIVNPTGAEERRAYVLQRMLDSGFITQSQYDEGKTAAVESKMHGPTIELEAPYIAEMARQDAMARLGPEAITAGYRVTTTVDSRLQTAAVNAVRSGLLEYDQRHGFRGAKDHVDQVPKDPKELRNLLEKYPSLAELQPAVVVAVADRAATVETVAVGRIELPWTGISWARPALEDGNVGAVPKSAGEILKKGDIVYVAQDRTSNWRLAQIPTAQSAFVAMNPEDGAIMALVGGFDYFTSSFNRAVQAKRQPGSSFKPFLYSAALEQDFTPATLINDAPFVEDDPSQEESWRPQNSSNKFYGPTRLREALVRSRNLVSIRIMKALGPDYATDYIGRFGFPADALPRNLTLALGTAQASPLEMSTAYSVFANGGFRVDPYYVERIEGPDGQLVFSASPKAVCAACEQPGDGTIAPSDMAPSEGVTTASIKKPANTAKQQIAPRVISAQNAYLMTDMMADVIKRGTATGALQLKRGDIAGKTGTTDESRDTWFCGFSPKLVGTAWVGFDQERTLGPGEEGGKTALPIWVYFMAEALKGIPDKGWAAPSGLVNMRISASTGLPAQAGEEDAIFETFIAGRVPASDGTPAEPASAEASNPTGGGSTSLF